MAAHCDRCGSLTHIVWRWATVGSKYLYRMIEVCDCCHRIHIRRTKSVAVK